MPICIGLTRPVEGASPDAVHDKLECHFFARVANWQIDCGTEDTVCMVASHQDSLLPAIKGTGDNYPLATVLPDEFIGRCRERLANHIRRGNQSSCKGDGWTAIASDKARGGKRTSLSGFDGFFGKRPF